MYCPHCNEYFPGNPSFCPRCGQPVAEEKQVDKQLNKTLIVLVSVLAGVLIVASLVTLFIFVSQNHRQPAASASTVASTVPTTPVASTVNEIVPLTTAKPTQPPTVKATAPPPTTAFESYTVWLDKGVEVHGKPSASSSVTYVIDTATYYTIVDEATDGSGRLWGKLKSGVGWVNLSHPEPETVPTTLSDHSFESYLVFLDEGVKVYYQPSTSSGVSYVIDIATNYTIVEEATDGSGRLWGKLKSGVGWVLLPS